MRIHKFHVFSRFWPIVPPTSRPAGVLRPWAARPHLTRYSGPRRGGQYGGGSAVRVFLHLRLRLGWVDVICADFMFFANYSPHHHPTGLLRPWMARPRLARRAGPRQGGHGAGGSVVFVFSWPRSCRLITQCHTSMQSGHLAILSERHRRPGN